jgi:hypothetical protein
VDPPLKGWCQTVPNEGNVRLILRLDPLLGRGLQAQAMSLSAAREFGKACMGPRRTECSAYLKHVGIAKETWHLQKTPMGSFVLVSFEAADVLKSFEIFAKSKEPFDVWFKEQALQVSGVDLSKPMDGPMPEQIFNMAP